MSKEAFVILIFVSSALCNVAKMTDGVLRTCYGDYLETSQEVQVKLCDEIMSQHVLEFIEKATQQMTDKDNKTCIMRIFEKYNFAAIYLRGLAKNYLSEVEDREDLESTMKLSFEQLLGAPRILCHEDRYFEDVYEHYKNIKPITNSSQLSIDDLCIIKYLMSNEIVNSKVLNSIAKSRLSEAKNCKDPMTKIERKFPTDSGYDLMLFGMPRNAVKKCIQHSMKQLKTSAHLYSLDFLLSKFRLDEQQKYELKRLFINMITASIKMTNKCISKIWFE